jgi:hypothetical protein
VLQAFGDNIWFADQPLRFWGLALGTRMTVVRGADRRLVVISPISLTPALEQALEDLGQVTDIVAPNRYHHLFASAFKARYPQAQLWAASGLAEKCPHLPINQVITAPAGTIAGELAFKQFPGIYVPSLRGADPLNEVVFYHAQSRCLIVTDIAFHFDASSPGFTRLLAKVIGNYEKLQSTLLEKWLIKDSTQVEQAIRSVLDWEFDRVIMAHGSPISSGAKEQLKAGYEWFLDRSLESA